MPSPRCASLFFAILSLAAAGELDDFHWRADFTGVARWIAQPSWLSAPSPTASVTTDGHTACFRVDEPRKGMKWSLALPMVPLAETPWLVLRYRAENLLRQSDDYFLYLDDGIEGRQLHALRLSEAVSDGQWHLVAVDVSTLTRAEAIRGLAVQVQSTERGARLWLDQLAFAESPPEGAETPRRVAQPPSAVRPDWIAPLAQARWNPQLGWLANPASEGRHSVERRGEATLFRVVESSKGMKWSWDLPEPAPLEAHRYVSMRYRATGFSPYSDYALCVLGRPRTGGHEYTPVIAPSELISDGRWHTLHADLRPAASRFPTIGAFALQAQAAAPDATLEVADIRFVNAIQPSRLADAIDWQPGARFDGFQPIPLGDAAKSDLAPWLRRLALADWFTAPEITAQGIPFRLAAGAPVRSVGSVGSVRGIPAPLAATGVRAKGDLRFPCDLRASEIYLLLLAAFVGPEEPVYGGGKLNALRDLDRFRLRLEYADGTADECLPLNAATKQFGIVAGPQVIVAAADDSKPLKAIVLRDACKQAAFAVVAITARQAGARAFAEAIEDSPPLKAKPSDVGWQRATVDTADFEEHKRLTVTNGPMRCVLDMSRLPRLERLVHLPAGRDLLAAPCDLAELTVDGRRIRRDQTIFLERVGRPETITAAIVCEYAIANEGQLRFSVVLDWTTGAGLGAKVFVTNKGREPRKIALVAPRIGPYRLSDRPEGDWYLFPKRGAVLDHRPCSLREPSSGLFPMQFADTFSPGEGLGLSLETEVCDHVEEFGVRRKTHFLEKTGGTFTIGIEYPEFLLEAGKAFHTSYAKLRFTDGRWSNGLESYGRRLKMWDRMWKWREEDAPEEVPKALIKHRQPWFREVFNFRQRFLWAHDPLYDAKTGEFHLEDAIEEAKREFGGIDFLHLFDWGNCGKYGRIYGRTGDYSPYDTYKGGQEALRKAIAGVRAKGVPVGLYLEGYLLDERGKLGQQFGKLWQMIGPDGKGRWWPQSTEMYVCPFVPAWREVQASTYAAKVKELDVDGMYLDEFGFAGANVDCWSKEHGHEVPGYAVVGERDCTKLVRERIEAAKKGVVLYTEESPVDVTTQFQDGSFTYAMAEARRTQTLVPLNLARFAFPDFKTIEILVCDHPTGSWATGVKWVFFNGEALWIEGPPDWFEPETREAIRRCYRILRKHKDAFTSLEPVPLVPTEMGGIWANKFPVQGKTVFTLYNSRHRTVRGELLRVPHTEGATYYDEWNQRPASFRRLGGDAAIALEIGPNDVGCLVVEKK